MKRLLEGLGRGGWISRLAHGSIAGGEGGGGDAGGFSPLGGEEGRSTGGCCASSARFLGGGEEDTSGSAPSVLGGKGKGASVGGRASTGGSSEGEEEGNSNRGRFAGGEACLVGDGELDSKRRFNEGELDTSGGPKEYGVGWESGISLGGVCQLSDWERRTCCTWEGVDGAGAVCGRGRAGVRSMRRCGVCLVAVQGRVEAAGCREKIGVLHGPGAFSTPDNLGSS